MRLLFDSDVLIRNLNGSATSRARELLRDQETQQISIIAWMEVMAGATTEVGNETRDFLKLFRITHIDDAISEETVRLRKTTRLMLPDAIIYATALVTGRTLVTYNSRDYPEGTPSVIVPL